MFNPLTLCEMRLLSVDIAPDDCCSAGNLSFLLSVVCVSQLQVEDWSDVICLDASTVCVNGLYVIVELNQLSCE